MRETYVDVRFESGPFSKPGSDPSLVQTHPDPQPWAYCMAQYLFLGHPPVEGCGGREVRGQPGTVHAEEVVRTPQNSVPVSQQRPGDNLGAVDTGSSPEEGSYDEFFVGGYLEDAVIALNTQS